MVPAVIRRVVSPSKDTLPIAITGLQAIKTQLEVTTSLKEEGRRISLEIVSKTGNLVGSIQYTRYPFCYHVNQIQVSKPNLRKGIGRLLQIEAAVERIDSGAFFIFPTFSFTAAGIAAFGKYPATPATLIKRKLPKAIESSSEEIIDVPFSRPEVEIAPLPTHLQILDVKLLLSGSKKKK